MKKIILFTILFLFYITQVSGERIKYTSAPVGSAPIPGDLTPATDDTYDIGENSTPLEWKDLYIDGTATIDTLQVDENATVTGDLQVDGTVTVSENGVGKDVKFYGTTSGVYFLWDASEDELALEGDLRVASDYYVNTYRIRALSPTGGIYFYGADTGSYQMHFTPTYLNMAGTFPLSFSSQNEYFRSIDGGHLDFGAGTSIDLNSGTIGSPVEYGSFYNEDTDFHIGAPNDIILVPTGGDVKIEGDLDITGNAGIITVDGIRLSEDETIRWSDTPPFKTITWDSTKHDFVFIDDIDIEDTHPHLNFRDIDDDTAYMWHLDTAIPYQYALWKGTDTGTGFTVIAPYTPLFYFDSNDDVYFPLSDLTVAGSITGDPINTLNIKKVGSGLDNLLLTFEGGDNITTADNCMLMGYRAGYSLTEGLSGTFIGNNAGYYTTIGDHDTFIGFDAGYENVGGSEDTYIGLDAGYSGTSASQSTCIGTYSGFSNVIGDGCVNIGYKAGYYETGSDKLYIDNSDTTTPLIYGDFSTDDIILNALTLVKDKIAFTQTDENEYIDSETDADMDYGATTSHDFKIGGTEQITLVDGIVEPTTQNDIDIGSADKKFKEIYVYHAQTQPSRALDTIYQNTTGHPIIVYGSCEFVSAQDTSNCYADCKTDSSNPPTTIRQRIGHDSIAAEQLEIIDNTKIGFFMVVADDDYYTITTTTGGTNTITLLYWNEVDF